MFGHNDDQKDDQNNSQADPSAMPAVVPDPSLTAGLHDGSADPGPASSAPSAPSVPGAPAAPNVVEPEEKPENSDGTSGTLPVGNGPTEDSGESLDSTDDNSTADNAVAAPEINELMGLKQQALQQLTPLVDHLEQTPEEKFRTTMMMIQASDDSSLVKTAFEAAQAITDDKVRAQALLDVINEINYFTQHKDEGETS